jgi:tellurite resistance protein TehA-like permease
MAWAGFTFPFACDEAWAGFTFPFACDVVEGGR